MLKRRNKCTWTMMEDSRTNHNDDNKTSDSHWTSKHKDRTSEETDGNIGLTPPYLLCLSQARTLISNAICCGVFEFNGLVWKTVVLGDCCSGRLLFWKTVVLGDCCSGRLLFWETVVRVVYIGGIFYHHY